MPDYNIPQGSLETSMEAKKSQFHCLCAPIDCREHAIAMVNQVKRKYPDAGHHCWAYLIGAPSNPTAIAYSDDGEPKGTAGKPILNVLRHNNIGDVIAVVSRYFGGVKLGTGGLMRAYSSAVVATLAKLPRQQKVRASTVSLTVEFRYEQYVRHLVTKYQGRIEQCDYSLGVSMVVLVADNVREAFIQELQPIVALIDKS